MINWIKKNKLELLFLVLTLGLALFLRLNKITQFLTFLGDEGRDVRIVRDLITEGNLVFIGPQTSVGNMYLGPLYYYMMAPALLLSGLNPVGPAIMIALLSVITILFVWHVARAWFGKEAALISAVLYAVSPIAIIYGRTSWNPNPMPLFAILSIWGIYQVWKSKKHTWMPIIGVSLAFALQMHYLALLLIPTVLLFWLITLKQIKKTKESASSFYKQSLLGAIAFLALMSPLLLFDIKHQWMNLKALGELLSGGSGVFNLSHIITKPIELFLFAFSALLTGVEKPQIISITISLFVALYLIKERKADSIKLISAWLLFVIVGLSFYGQSVYIHYLGLIYPAVFIVSGAVVSKVSKANSVIKWTALILVMVIIINNLRTSPAFGTPNRQLQRTEEVADLIIKESKGEPFNFGLISKQNYDESYRYFLENKDASLEKDQNKKTDQLFVVCEDGESCAPEGHSQYQIAVFGVAHIESQWQIENIKIYRLVHTK